MAVLAVGASVLYAVVFPDSSQPRGLAFNSSSSPLAVDAVAWGTWVDSINQTGWATLEIHSNSSFPDKLQAYAAGLLEGAVTQRREYLHLRNTCEGQTFDNGLSAYLNEQWDWMKKQADAQGAIDTYWYQVGRMLDQQEGLFDGYNMQSQVSERLTGRDFYCGTLSGDLDDLTSVFVQPSQRARSSESHCSVLVKPIGDPAAPTELYIGHTTWGGYESMTRVYKNYDFPFRLNGGSEEQVAARQISFSSYPATLFR
jgi:hypothetical protein